MTIPLTEHQVIYILGAILLLLRIKSLYDQKKYISSAEEIQRASVALVNPLRSQVELIALRISKCEAEMIEQKESNERLYAGVNLLIKQLEIAGIKPIWTPRDRDRPLITKGAHIDYR